MSRRTIAVWSIPIVLAAASVTGPARADDANPLFELVDAAAQRLQTAEPVAATKWKTHDPIEDPQRVKQVLDAVSADAAGRGLDPQDVTRIFTDQINATEAIEYARFAQWKLDPTSAPPAPADLSTSRAAIDELNKAMVQQLSVVMPALGSPDCDDRLGEARDAVADSRQLDPLYRQALSFVTRSYCRL